MSLGLMKAKKPLLILPIPAKAQRQIILFLVGLIYENNII
ncbi:MAG: hypothetical protein ACJASL_004425 [Paraglaciecola sp.]|jgi:hypothetical protein